MKKILIFLLKFSPVMVSFACIAGLLTGIANTLAIALINKGISYNGNAPNIIMVGFLAVCFLLPLFRVISQIMLTYISETATYSLRMKLAEQVLHLPLRRLEEKGPSKLLTALTTDVERIGVALSNIPSIFMNVSIVISGFVYLFWLFWPAGLAVLVIAIVGVGMFSYASNMAVKYFNKAREERDVFFKHFRMLTDGSKELKLHKTRRQHFMEKMLDPSGRTYKRNSVSGFAWFAGSGSLGQLVLFMAIGALVFALPKYFDESSTQILTGFSMVLLYLTLPLNDLVTALPGISMASISLNKVEAMGVSFKKETTEEDEIIQHEPSWQSLEYRDVMHCYYREKEDRNFSMGPLNLSFQPGELVFIIGGNGSGKTTLAKLILGLYTPESGQVLLDGEKVKEENRDSFRQFFTAVFSDFFLFENMMGVAPNQDLAAKNYLDLLQLSNKVTYKDGELSTIDLSQGQRKRLALLTAYLEDRPIYLFDEWASDQDPHFKEIFYNVLLPELKSRNKTVIVITHDDHYFQAADRIIKLEYGKIEYDRSLARQ